MSKYYLSLCSIIKDERYLEEFIIYYNILGVEHFYIYDNESSYSISDRLNKPYFQKLCTILKIKGQIQQLNAYNDCIQNFGKETKWLIVVDGDEYIVPKKDWSMRDFLNKYEDAHAIGINWVMYGSSFYDKKQEGLLINNYRYCSNTQNKHIKTVFQPKYVKNFTKDPHHLNIHNPSKYIDAKRNIISGPFNNNFTIDIIQINHYTGKSKEEQYEKNKRGYPDHLGQYNVPNDNVIHTLYNDVIDNFIADKYLDHVKSYFEKNNL